VIFGVSAAIGCLRAPLSVIPADITEGVQIILGNRSERSWYTPSAIGSAVSSEEVYSTLPIALFRRSPNRFEKAGNLNFFF